MHTYDAAPMMAMTRPKNIPSAMHEGIARKKSAICALPKFAAEDATSPDARARIDRTMPKMRIRATISGILSCNA